MRPFLFLKVGSMYVNIARVTEVRDTGVDIEIFYEGDKPTTFRGSDAESLRAWLDSVAVDFNHKLPEGE
jgi:hypothetical protein